MRSPSIIYSKENKNEKENEKRKKKKKRKHAECLQTNLLDLLLMCFSRGNCELLSFKFLEQATPLQLNVVDLIARVTAIDLLPCL